ncbi:AlpA family phage regulatory protein [Bradyrhizobium pachyrhizi]|uniref:helix-turn-helix transcriptional regulator n=1 Tax=Bradyrhizobium pachyrhizi TaxID=280333 RepID=UPI0024B1671C|nr:AlpA family phage regulatory protein [Bradyrhizobium pachyrhizi]WFU53029.1 AlpA family phage regulatory protein [Bradyrhizobium pachyrhizi]
MKAFLIFTVLSSLQVMSRRFNTMTKEDVALDRTGIRIMLSETQVLQIVPVSSVTLWRMVKRREFPSPSFITPNKKVWFEDEVAAWQASVTGRIRGRRRTSREREAAAAAITENTPTT